MILISSGAYVIGEFQAELGKIPPCFLPLGNKKLLEHQVDSLKSKFLNEQIIVSLPESYQLSLAEQQLLATLGVIAVAVPDDFSLSESVSYAIHITNYLPEDNTIRIMYGDTLIHDLPEYIEQDILGVSISQDSYNWKVEENSNQPLIWCGFYSFKNKSRLIRCLALKRNSFVDAVELYRTEQSCILYNFKQWFDLGHVNTYFRSRAQITTQRAFNELRIENGVVYKTGQPSVKIQAEGLWFERIPTSLKIFTPQLIENYLDQNQQAHYALEYLPNMPLNELFVHGKNTGAEWQGLFKLLGNFLQKAQVNISQEQKKQIENDFTALVKDKTYTRIQQYAEVDINQPTSYANVTLPSLKEICDICIERVLQLPQLFAISHGDLCFSNILYDSRAFQIKVIDPRGMNTAGEFTIYGDQKYDLAKLTHSIIGLYDHIIAGRYTLVSENNTIEFDIDARILDIQEHFLKCQFIENMSIVQIMPLVVLLFISMLPLHSDRPDRQKAMLTNALRLYSEHIKNEL